MTKTPREYQQRAFERFKDAVILCLNFACGLGKTFVFAWIARYRQKPTMIIAPKRVCKQWYQELIEEGVDPKDIFLADKPSETKDPEGYKKRFQEWLER